MVLCNEHIVLSIKHMYIYIYIEVLKDLFCYVEYIQTCDKRQPWNNLKNVGHCKFDRDSLLL